MLLKNVIGPVLLEALVEDVNNNYFSLITQACKNKLFNRCFDFDN
jgi:hypothetical protein